MPTNPDFTKGEGLIRSAELVKQLQSDVYRAYEELEKDKKSQYLRRAVVRCIFSYIESAIEAVKVEMRSYIKSGLSTYKPNEKEINILGSQIYISSLGKKGLGIPVHVNFKDTFRLAKKIWNLKKYKFNPSIKDYNDFRDSQKARNCLTHPKTYYDVQVSDLDMHCHTIAFHLVKSNFTGLLKNIQEMFLSRLPEKDRKLMDKLIKELQNDIDL